MHEDRPMGTLTIILTNGPYISQYAEMAGNIAREANAKAHKVNIFLYLDAVHIPKDGQNPAFFANAGGLFADLARLGVKVEACPRCATARGYAPEGKKSRDYVEGIAITSLYRLAEMLEESDRVVTLAR
jgi:tRNA 2-thiouridine synthesizing protein D